ncbi:hypothetical protein D3C73_759180 [compost metagenome]
MDQIIEEANSKIIDKDKKLDLNKVLPLDKTAGVDPAMEAKKKEELKKLDELKKKKEAEKKKEEEAAKAKLQEALKKLEEAKKKQLEANKKAEEEAKAKAEAELKKPVAPVPTPTPSTGGSTEEPSTPSPKPASISLIGPVGTSDSSNFDVDIMMNDFNQANSIYGIQVHLVYSGNVKFRGNPMHTGDDANSVFSNPETYGEKAKEEINGQNKELVYSIFNLPPTSEVPSFTGSRQLVRLPFFAAMNEVNISVGYIKIVRKDSVEWIKIDPNTISPVSFKMIP